MSGPLLLLSAPLLAHNVAATDGAFLSTTSGAHPGVFSYLGAKHMVTGVDHVLFLLGAVFYLSSVRELVLLASAFTVGHSLTLVTGVLAEWPVSEVLIDALIGLSVSYKAWDNLRHGGTFRSTLPWIVLAIGLLHGLGLASKLSAFALDPAARLANLLAFNLGIELGQLLVLGGLLLLLGWWRSRPGFTREARWANYLLLLSGLLLCAAQLRIGLPGLTPS
ncbi:MAG: HupE/UreJ family protein [Pseudomonadota bacterium]